MRADNIKGVEINRKDGGEHPGAGFAIGMNQRVGETLCPAGMVYEATAAVHIFFRKDEFGIGRTEYAFVAVSNGFQEVVEAQADAAMKELVRHLMTKYGRDIPEFRKS